MEGLHAQGREDVVRQLLQSWVSWRCVPQCHVVREHMWWPWMTLALSQVSLVRLSGIYEVGVAPHPNIYLIYK
jgi:hypothetical protein